MCRNIENWLYVHSSTSKEEVQQSLKICAFASAEPIFNMAILYKSNVLFEEITFA